MSDYDLHSALGYQLTLTARYGERRFEAAMKTIGLTRITWCILLAAGGKNLPYPSDIADYIGIDRTATSRALRQMEADGLLGRSLCKKDRRKTSVQLTKLGRARLEQANTLANTARHETEARLSAPEQSELKRLLTKLRAGENAPLKGL